MNTERINGVLGLATTRGEDCTNVEFWTNGLLLGISLNLLSLP